MSARRRIGLGILIVIALVAVACFKTDSSDPPDQFEPPPGIFPDQVGKLMLERKLDKNPACIRNGPVSCTGFYVDPPDPDGSRIYHFVEIFETPAEAVARLEESAGEKVIDETESSWETLPGSEGDRPGRRLLVKFGFRRDADQSIGSCSLSYTDGPMLISITSGFSCDAARQFLKDLPADRN